MIYVHVLTHTHTHTHVHLYIYIHTNVDMVAKVLLLISQAKFQFIISQNFFFFFLSRTKEETHPIFFFFCYWTVGERRASTIFLCTTWGSGAKSTKARVIMASNKEEREREREREIGLRKKLRKEYGER